MGFVKLETSETRGMGLSFIRIIEFGMGRLERSMVGNWCNKGPFGGSWLACGDFKTY